FEAFTTPPLAAFSSCDAKFTTTEMAKELKCVALFGPPRGKTWEPSDWERSHYRDIKPLVSNDWTILKGDAPAPPPSDAKQAVDLEGDGDKPEEAKAEDRLIRPAAWHGTILPGADADLWLAAAFADFERFVALERALKGDGGKLSKAAEERLGVGHVRVPREIPIGRPEARQGRPDPVARARHGEVRGRMTSPPARACSSWPPCARRWTPRGSTR
ncbi:MAG: hypothetical protein WKF75_01405, partial [Singulisphaera sp.]